MIPEADREALKMNFELGTAEMIKAGKHAANEILRMSGLLFSQYYPLAGNAYRRLARSMEAKSLLSEVPTATLNYDCLWELAVVEETGRACAYFQDSSGSVRILKPHGSSNFRNNGMHATPGSISWTPTGVVFDGPTEAIDPRDVPPSIIGNGIPPAMAFFETTKAIPVSRSVIEHIQGEWADAATKAERISIIGVRPNTHDKHIFQPLVESKARIQIVSPGGDLSAWTAIGIDATRLSAVKKSFDKAIDDVVSFVA